MVRIIKWLYLESQTEVLSDYSKICFYLGRERKFSFGEGHKVKAGFLFSCKHSVISHISWSSMFLMELHLTLGADFSQKAFPYIYVDYLD